jgi:hypothetical protein
MSETKTVEPSWPYTGNGCDATNGGPHSPIKEGSYTFCGKCGETIRHARRRDSVPPTTIERTEA